MAFEYIATLNCGSWQLCNGSGYIPCVASSGDSLRKLLRSGYQQDIHRRPQDYPTRIVTLVSPFPPGGPSDTAARLVAAPMSKALGQQIVIENVTGAGGTIGTNRVAKAASDGYALIVSGSGTHAAAEFLHNGLSYRSTDFEQIGLINTSPMILVARDAVPANTLKEFVAYLRANDKKVTEADAGVGSISNLACSVFHSLANVHPTVVSYRGTPQATMDLLSGNVDFGCNQIVNILQHVNAGKLKAYAVTSDKRSPMLPNVPPRRGCRNSISQFGSASRRRKALHVLSLKS